MADASGLYAAHRQVLRRVDRLRASMGLARFGLARSGGQDARRKESLDHSRRSCCTTPSAASMIPRWCGIRCSGMSRGRAGADGTCPNGRARRMAEADYRGIPAVPAKSGSLSPTVRGGRRAYRGRNRRVEPAARSRGTACIASCSCSWRRGSPRATRCSARPGTARCSSASIPRDSSHPAKWRTSSSSRAIRCRANAEYARDRAGDDPRPNLFRGLDPRIVAMTARAIERLALYFGAERPGQGVLARAALCTGSPATAETDLKAGGGARIRDPPGRQRRAAPPCRPSGGCTSSATSAAVEEISRFGPLMRWLLALQGSPAPSAKDATRNVMFSGPASTTSEDSSRRPRPPSAWRRSPFRTGRSFAPSRPPASP